MNDSIGEKIKKRRIALGLSQTELARRAGYADKSGISKIESGDRGLTPEKIELFARALDMNPADLFPSVWERTLRIEPSLWGRLEPFLRESENGRVFLFGGAGPLSITSVARQMAIGIEASGVRRIRLHDLRHCWATNAIASGANIVAVSRYLGHATIQQTLETYTHLLQKSDDELLEIMGGLDG